jgi:hypothetical protein
MVRSVWHVGSKGGLWLVEEGGGEGERGTGVMPCSRRDS